MRALSLALALWERGPPSFGMVRRPDREYRESPSYLEIRVRIFDEPTNDRRIRLAPNDRRKGRAGCSVLATAAGPQIFARRWCPDIRRPGVNLNRSCYFAGALIGIVRGTAGCYPASRSPKFGGVEDFSAVLIARVGSTLAVAERRPRLPATCDGVSPTGSASRRSIRPSCGPASACRQLFSACSTLLQERLHVDIEHV